MHVTITSPLGKDTLYLERLHAHEELGRPYRYDLHVRLQDGRTPLAALLGQLVCVHVEVQKRTGPYRRTFNGYVTTATALGGDSRKGLYYLELRPWLALLQNRVTCRIFQNVTVIDVIQAVVKPLRFDVLVPRGFSEPLQTWENVVQYRESDLDFIMRLMEQEGLFYFFRTTEKGQELLIVDDIRNLDPPEPHCETVSYRPAGEHSAHTTDVFYQWTFTEQLCPTSALLDDYDFRRPGAELFSHSGHPARLVEDQDEPSATVYDYPGAYKNEESEGRFYANRRLQELRAERYSAQAAGNVDFLRAGSLFKLEDHPEHKNQEEQNAEYVVTTADIVITAASLESNGGAGASMSFMGSYTVLNTLLPFRLKRTTLKPLINGPQTAVVVGQPGEEIHTDEFGRVRVHFRWDQTWSEQRETGPKTKKDHNNSCWVRVAQPWASAGFGFQAIPRVGDEVVVEFLEGDPDRPLITGSVYNGDRKFPFELPKHATQTGIKTRSTKGGNASTANMIRMEDEKGKEELLFQAERDHKIIVRHNRLLSIGGSDDIEVDGARTLTVVEKNSETYKAEHEVIATKKVTITCGANKIVIAPDGITVSGTLVKIN